MVRCTANHSSAHWVHSQWLGRHRTKEEFLSYFRFPSEEAGWARSVAGAGTKMSIAQCVKESFIGGWWSFFLNLISWFMASWSGNLLGVVLFGLKHRLKPSPGGATTQRHVCFGLRSTFLWDLARQPALWFSTVVGRWSQLTFTSLRRVEPRFEKFLMMVVCFTSSRIAVRSRESIVATRTIFT